MNKWMVASFGLMLASVTFAGAETWLQPAIDAASAKGGGKVVVPAGEHPCKSLRLRSNVELHLAKGARLVGSTNSADYVSFPDEICAIHPENSAKVFIYGWDLENVAITGEGVIDGQGPKFFDQSTVLWQYFWAKPACERPRMLQLVNCRGIRLEGTTFKDSPCWTMLIKKCENVVFERIKVLADLHIVNSDGVDFDTCRHVRVKNCEFSTGDDCFAIRAIRDPGSDRPAICEDIEIADCNLVSNCQTIRFGCPSDDEIRNLTVRNIKGRGGYCINFDYPAHYLSPRDDGYLNIHDILIENYTGEARHVGLRIKAEPGVKLRSVRNITFRKVNIKCPKPAVFISNVFTKMENIRFEEVVFNGVRQADGPVEVDAANAQPLKRADGHSWESNEKGKGKPQPEAASPEGIPGLIKPDDTRNLYLLPEWRRRFRTLKSSADQTRQPFYWYDPGVKGKVPLVVAFHSWGASCHWTSPAVTVQKYCERHGWAMVYPNFRGPNVRPEACGSDLACQDVLDVIKWAQAEREIDADRIYLIGGSGGGYFTLLMGGRYPEIFAGAAAFCPISDLTRWHRDAPGHYPKNIAAACGGSPEEKPSEYSKRSPLTYLANARAKRLPFYIVTGIHDGHTGSVKVGHALRAFNALADANDRLSEEEIATIENTEKVPEALAFKGEDPFYSKAAPIHLRRTSASARVTIFEAGHAGNYAAGLDFLSRQRRGRPADMNLPLKTSAQGKVESITK